MQLSGIVAGAIAAVSGERCRYAGEERRIVVAIWGAAARFTSSSCELAVVAAQRQRIPGWTSQSKRFESPKGKAHSNRVLGTAFDAVSL